MNDILNFFGTGSFIPHGHCYLWNPSLVWLHLASDTLIAFAYYSIPLTLFYFVRKRQDLPFHQVFLLFAVFIIACGTTHIAAIWTLWYPTYWLSGVIKAFTAVASLFTAIELATLIPKALVLPSSTQLEQANQALQFQIQERLQVTEKLRQSQSQLEQRVQERTRELVTVNQQLQREINDRERTEAALRRSEFKFRRLVDANIIGVVSANTQGAITDANDAFLTMVGYSRAELLAQQIRWDAMTPSEWNERDQLALQELRTRGAVTAYEKEFFHKDGHRVPIFVGTALLEDRSEAEGNLISFILDLSERKRTEQEIRLLNQNLERRVTELQTLLDVVPVGIAIAEDPQCRVIRANSFFQRIFNIQADANLSVTGETRPVPVKRLQDNRELQPHELPMQIAATQGIEVRNSEMQIVRPDGNTFHLLGSAIPLFDAQGAVCGSVAVSMDISDRKRVEAEREQLLIREQAAREQAENANRIKDEFLAVLSHELRSPLNPILGWAKLLQTRTLDPETTRHALAAIERNAKLQTQLIEDLLDVSRILQGKMSLNVAPVDLMATIEAGLETVRLAAEAKGLQINEVLSPTVGKVSGDAARLQQVVWNLLSNAVKFTPAGGQIEVRLQQLGSLAEIQIKDSGKGINPDFIPYIFDYFRQEDSTITRKFGGLGLGLAIVRHIIEMHGGTVKAESLGEGFGATFIVQLPLLPYASTPAQPSQIPTVVSLAGVRVLVVDDEADMRELVQFILEGAGAKVCAVASAAEVLDQLKSFSADVFVSDIGMPDVDGYSLMRQIRAMSSDLAAIPAIALTAYAGEADQKQALAVGFQMHLSKPIEPEKLIHAIVCLKR